MAFTCILGQFDFSPYARLAQGDGFDPVDPDKLEPQYGEPGVGDGAPLINVTAHNREIVVPVLLDPRKSGGTYPYTKDGLHLMIQAVNRSCTAGGTLEWRDRDATVSTFFDVEFARFELDYSYWRQAHSIAAGVVRITTRPYGHTGTYRHLGLATGYGSASISATGLEGDAPADVEIVLSQGSAFISDWFLAGYTVVPPGHRPVALPDQAHTVAPTSALVGASWAVASQVWRHHSHPSWPTRWVLAPASAYQGRRHRIIAVAKRDHIGQGGAILPHMWLGRPPMHEDVSTATTQLPYNTNRLAYDLGVVDFPKGSPTPSIDVMFSAPSSPVPVASTYIDFSHLLVLPEDSTMVAVYGSAADVLAGPAAISSASSSITVTNATNPTIVRDMSATRRGAMPRPPAATDAAIVAFAYDAGPGRRTATADVRVRERFAFHR